LVPIRQVPGAKGGSEMTRSRPLGLDELMIVNPGCTCPKAVLLGEDGTLYQVQGLGQEVAYRAPSPFVRGADGRLYKVQGTGLGGPGEYGEGLDEERSHLLGRLFLGDDGLLYEVLR